MQTRLNKLVMINALCVLLISELNKTNLNSIIKIAPGLFMVLYIIIAIKRAESRKERIYLGIVLFVWVLVLILILWINSGGLKL